MKNILPSVHSSDQWVQILESLKSHTDFYLIFLFETSLNINCDTCCILMKIRLLAVSTLSQHPDVPSAGVHVHTIAAWQKVLHFFYCCSFPLTVLLFFPSVLEGYPALDNTIVDIFSPHYNVGRLLFSRVHHYYIKPLSSVLPFKN